MDEKFIHFALESQVEGVASKFWKDTSYWLLKVNPKKLSGRLVFEANRNGGDKYYHLHEGSIPINAIVGSEFRSNG